MYTLKIPLGINADGRLLFGTNYGLVVLDANKVENMEKLASTVFTGLHINGAAYVARYG